MVIFAHVQYLFSLYDWNYNNDLLINVLIFIFNTFLISFPQFTFFLGRESLWLQKL